MVEKEIEWYGQLKGLKYAIMRYFNVCGASDDGLVGDSKSPSVLLFQNATRGALGLEEFFITSATVDTPDKTPISKLPIFATHAVVRRFRFICPPKNKFRVN